MPNTKSVQDHCKPILKIKMTCLLNSPQQPIQNNVFNRKLLCDPRWDYKTLKSFEEENDFMLKESRQ